MFSVLCNILATVDIGHTSVSMNIKYHTVRWAPNLNHHIEQVRGWLLPHRECIQDVLQRFYGSVWISSDQHAEPCIDKP